jgi:hypothetical protein
MITTITNTFCDCCLTLYLTTAFLKHKFPVGCPSKSVNYSQHTNTGHLMKNVAYFSGLNIGLTKGLSLKILFEKKGRI